jgi:O-glycosyl hydrolase
MTEYSSGSYSGWNASLDWASKMHVLLTTGGVNAIDYLWGFFGEKYATDALVSIDFDDGVYRGHRLTPVGAIMGQYARFVRPGSVRVEATSSTDEIAVTAYREGRRLVVVATNPGSTRRLVRVAVKGRVLRGPVRQVRSSSTERLRGLPPLRSHRNGFSATLAARSLTTFTVTR